MKIIAIIKYLLAQEGTTMTKIAERMQTEKNVPLSMNNLSRKLRSDTIKYKEVADIADLLGYDIKFEKRR